MDGPCCHDGRPAALDRYARRVVGAAVADVREAQPDTEPAVAVLHFDAGPAREGEFEPLPDVVERHPVALARRGRARPAATGS